MRIEDSWFAAVGHWSDRERGTPNELRTSTFRTHKPQYSVSATSLFLTAIALPSLPTNAFAQTQGRSQGRQNRKTWHAILISKQPSERRSQRPSQTPGC